MYQKYFVYLDDGTTVLKIAVAAVSEDAARRYCDGNGEVIAVRDVTEDFHIPLGKVEKSLISAGFDRYERDFMLRALIDLGIIEI